jgi:RNA polymerase sigma-70 factor, ECF subfamily
VTAEANSRVQPALEPASTSNLDALAEFEMDAVLIAAGCPPECVVIVREQIDALLKQGRAQFPGWPISAEQFARHIAAKFAVITKREASLEAGVRKLRGADLYLALGASMHLREALQAFEEYAMKDADKAISRFAKDQAARNEVRQALRVRLLVADGRPAPRVHDYHGKGPLAGWVQVSAVRLGIEYAELRAKGDHESNESTELDAFTSATDDPEIEFLRERYADGLRASMKEALAQLDGQERMLLRMHYQSNLATEEIAGILQVHRATVARWLQAARDSVRKLTLAQLRASLGLRSDEAKSLLRLVDSRFQASLLRLLG